MFILVIPQCTSMIMNTLVLIALILFEIQIPMHAKPRMANVLSSVCQQDRISVSVSALQDMSVKTRPTVQVSTRKPTIKEMLFYGFMFFFLG